MYSGWETIFENVHMVQADKVIASKCVCVWRGACMCGIE